MQITSRKGIFAVASRYKQDLMTIQKLMSEKLARSLSSLCYLTLVPGRHPGPTRGDHKSHTSTQIRLLDYQPSFQSSAQCCLCSCNSSKQKQAWGEGKACPFQSHVNKNYAHLLRRYALQHDIQKQQCCHCAKAWPLFPLTHKIKSSL